MLESPAKVVSRTVILLSVGAALCFAQEANEPDKPLPRVEKADVPFYPPSARVARIDGTVRLRVSTDGNRIASILEEHGHPMLLAAAKDNVATWQFRKHDPIEFEVIFRYEMLPEAECAMDSGTVVLMLPAEVQVKAKGVRTCDHAAPPRRRR